MGDRVSRGRISQPKPERLQGEAAGKRKRQAKLQPVEKKTLAEFHESAYRMGWGTMVSILERVVMLGDARNTTFKGASLERCQPDAVFVRGMLDAAGVLFGDAAPLMRSDFGVQLQEAIMDDFWDNSRYALSKAYEREPKLPYWFR
jgi:hypothetical protein